MEEVAINTFITFLAQKHPSVTQNGKRWSSIQETINETFHVLSDTDLRSIIDEALRYREGNAVKQGEDFASVFGSWGLIIDTMKSTMMQKRDQAGSNFQQLVRLGMADEPQVVVSYIKKLSRDGSIDHLFMGILNDTLQAVTAAGQEEHMYMIHFFRDTIEETKQQSTSSVGKRSAEDDDTIEKDEVEVLALIEAGQELDKLISDCTGNVKLLQEKLLQKVRTNGADRYFLQVIDDNLAACEAAGYQNKAKLLTLIKNLVMEQLRLRENIDRFSDLTEKEALAADLVEGASSHHAPQFIDPETNSSYNSTPLVSPLHPSSFIDAARTDITEKPRNNKKKKEKKEAKQRVLTLAEEISEHFAIHGWAVVDNFLPLDLVRRVRIEVNLFKSHYEQSEIWVGKRSDMGAHVRVPSVRGDQVLWMCGGHQTGTAVEGVSRVIKARGEIEPCKLEVKASAPIRRFAGMKELVAACDKLIDGLKEKVSPLQGIFERSDLMFSIFAGDGARFAKHVDNTTADGRRLTMVIYLNPGWEESQGGALRLSEGYVEGQMRPMVDVYPVAGRIVMFLSAAIPHEVLPTFAERHAISIWYYDRSERQQAIERAKETGSGNIIARSNIAAQEDAKEFIAALMGGDHVPDDGGEPTIDELQTLCQRVVQLSPAAVEIVSSITGALSPQSFRDGFPGLTTNDLKSMRALFRRMGLQN